MSTYGFSARTGPRLQNSILDADPAKLDHAAWRLLKSLPVQRFAVGEIASSRALALIGHRAQ